jgi:hypothetical protein
LKDRFGIFVIVVIPLLAGTVVIHVVVPRSKDVDAHVALGLKVIWAFGAATLKVMVDR